MPAWSSLPIEKINAGRYRVVMRYEDGKTEEKTIEVKRAQDVTLKFNHRLLGPEARLNTLGGSVGMGIAFDPAFAVTVQGTIATGYYQFLDLGMDIGLGYWGLRSYSGKSDDSHYSISGDLVGSENDDIDKYSSLRLFVRYAFFQPFSNGGGWHVGLGGSFITQTITGDNYYKETVTITNNGFAGEFATGFIFRNGITLSANFWIGVTTEIFADIGVKLAVGYSYRFKGKEK